MDFFRFFFYISLLLITLQIQIHSTSSGETNYNVLSTINMANKPSLTIEKNGIFSNRFNIVSDENFNSPSTSENWSVSQSTSNREFQNTRLVLISIPETLGDFEISVSSETCVFPFLFGSKSKPTVSVSGKVAKLDTVTTTSNFEAIFGNLQEFSSILYSSKDYQSELSFNNIFCPFYFEVRFFYFHKKMSLTIRIKALQT